MSIAELKSETKSLPRKQRRELARFIAELERRDDIEALPKLLGRPKRKRANEYWTLEDLERHHALLIAQGF